MNCLGISSLFHNSLAKWLYGVVLPSGWVLSLFVGLLLSLSPSLHAFEEGIGDAPITDLEKAHRAVWRIQNVNPKEKFINGRDYFGTATAIGNKYLLTNFHVWNGLLTHGKTIRDIYLVQKGRSMTLTVDKLLAVSGAYDMALVQINESVEDYLALSDNVLSDSGESLLLIGYASGRLTRAREMADIIYYEDVPFLRRWNCNA